MSDMTHGGGRSPSVTNATVLEIEVHLVEVTPRIWRRLRVPADLSLLDLHHAIQVVMGWLDYHLHLFEVGDREYGPRPEEEWEREQWAGDDGAMTLAKAFADGQGALDYLYDFGDDWRVRVRRIGHVSSEMGTSVSCLDGERAGPPEDCGGPHAYQEIVDTLAAHGRRGLPRELRSWLPENFDPAAFDVTAINKRLRLAFRQKASADQLAGPHASEQQELLATLTLATLVLGSRLGKQGRREAAKAMRTEILDSLQEADLIYTDAKRKTVVITEAGMARVDQFLQGLRTAKP
jgi:pRiA4b ORF-3-like protein